MRRALPWPPNKDFFFSFLQILREPGCANLIESCAFSQTSHGCNYKLNTVAWLVELTYGHVVFICEGFVEWPWEGAFHCNGTHTLNLTESVEVILVTSVKQLIRLCFVL